MRNKKLGIVVLCLTLSFFQIMVFLSTDSVRAVDVGPGVYFQCGNENYTFATNMSFSSITIDSDYIIFNNTGFYITSSNNINITLAYLNENISGAVIGEKILEFNASTTNGNVWFNLSGFRAGRGYNVNRSGTITNVTANSSGYISFSNSSWSSEKKYQIFRGGNSPPYFSNTSVNNGSTGISIGTSSLDITIEDLDGDTFNWTIETSPNVGSSSGNSETNGSKTCSISGLAYSTTYTWYVNATDGNASTNESYYFTTEPEPSNPPSGGGYTPSLNKAPTADADGPYFGYVNLTITFRGSGADLDGTIAGYEWDFNNDGTYDTGWLTTNTTTHTYTSAGNYTVKLQVKDDDNATGTDTATVNVTELPLELHPPVARTNGPYSKLTFENITFDGTGSTDVDGTITNYTWDFGDGTTAYGVTVTHSYTTAGLFNVTLTVTDDDGLTNTSTTTANIILDSDADGLSDEIELTLGSNPENASDVMQIPIDGTIFYLVDINSDGQPEKFYDLVADMNTTIEIQDGKYLLDINGDDKPEKIYDPTTREVTSYEVGEEPSNEFPWLLVVIGVLIAIVVIIVILFLTGYIYIEGE